MSADDFVDGHSILALERFMDDTRHMIIFDVLSWKSPVGEKGERLRLFLSDMGYAKAQASEKRGEIKIRKHAVPRLQFSLSAELTMLCEQTHTKPTVPLFAAAHFFSRPCLQNNEVLRHQANQF